MALNLQRFNPFAQFRALDELIRKPKTQPPILTPRPAGQTQMMTSTLPSVVQPVQSQILTASRPQTVVNQGQENIARTVQLAEQQVGQVGQQVDAPPGVYGNLIPGAGGLPAPQPRTQFSQIGERVGGIEETLNLLRQRIAANEAARTKDAGFSETEKAFVSAGQISPEEIANKERINALLSSYEAGQRAIQDKPIPMEFITGQRAALERRATGQLVPLQRQLELEQQKRQAAFDVAKTKYGIEKEKRTERIEKEKPIEVGGALLKFNPKTGKYDTLFEKPAEEKRSPSYQEYLDAKGEGYVGSFSQYQKEDANRKARAAGTSGLTDYQTISLRNQIEDNLRQNPAVKSYTEMVNFGVPVVLERFNSGQADSVSDMILMRSLAKVTDPTTGVREEEYRTFENAIGAIGKIMTLPKNWIGKGRLTETGRADMIREIQDRFNLRAKDYEKQYGYYKNQAERYGLTVPPSYQMPNENQQQEINQLKSLGYSDAQIQQIIISQ